MIRSNYTLPTLREAAVSNGEHNHTVYRNKAEVPYIHLDNLGRGNYALVDKVQTKGPQLDFYARKIIRTRYFRATAEQERIMSEINIVRKLRHSHIVRLVETYQAGLEFGIIMSPVAEMDLSEFLVQIDSQQSEVGRTSLRKWTGCLVSAVQYIHSQRIRHKDLKPANILIRREDIFITDFGISKDLVNDATTGSVGYPSERTPMYCAPETNSEGERRGRAADMFSLGCVLFEMTIIALMDSLAEFEGYRITDGSRAYAANYDKTCRWIIRLSMTQKGSESLSTLATIAALLDPDPNKRPQASDLPACDGCQPCTFSIHEYLTGAPVNFKPGCLLQVALSMTADPNILPDEVLDGSWLVRKFLGELDEVIPLGEENWELVSLDEQILSKRHSSSLALTEGLRTDSLNPQNRYASLSETWTQKEKESIAWSCCQCEHGPFSPIVRASCINCEHQFCNTCPLKVVEQ